MAFVHLIRQMEVLRRRIDAFQEEEAVRAKVLEDEIRIAELDYSARRARQSMIDEVRNSCVCMHEYTILALCAAGHV